MSFSVDLWRCTSTMKSAALPRRTC
jgi:hypothetical protein